MHIHTDHSYLRKNKVYKLPKLLIRTCFNDFLTQVVSKLIRHHGSKQLLGVSHLDDECCDELTLKIVFVAGNFIFYLFLKHSASWLIEHIHVYLMQDLFVLHTQSSKHLVEFTLRVNHWHLLVVHQEWLAETALRIGRRSRLVVNEVLEQTGVLGVGCTGDVVELAQQVASDLVHCSFLVRAIHHEVVYLGGLLRALLALRIRCLVVDFFVWVIQVVQGESVHKHFVSDRRPTGVEWTAIFRVHRVWLFIARHQEVVIKPSDAWQVRELARSLRSISLAQVWVVCSFALVRSLHQVSWPVHII